MEVEEKLIKSWLTSSVSSELKSSGTEIHTVSFTFLDSQEDFITFSNKTDKLETLPVMKSQLVCMHMYYTMKTNRRIKMKLHMSPTFIPDTLGIKFLVSNGNKTQWNPEPVQIHL